MLRNAVPMLILSSAAHRFMSGRYLILRSTGRKSGRTYGFPLAYIRDRERLIVSTDSHWRSNVTGGRPVDINLKGGWSAGTGRRVTDHETAVRLLGRLVNEVPGYARTAGIGGSAARISDADLARALDERWVIAITSDGGMW